MKDFKNLYEATQFFSTEEKCHEYLAQLRWNGAPACPHCGSVKVYKLNYKFRYKCGEKECKKDFTAKVGTFFEQSHIPLRKIFLALYIVTSHKKGISGLQLSKDIGITQRSSWFLLHRIREMLKDTNPELVDGIVEVDSFWSGGLLKNKHSKDRKKYRDNPFGNKTPMLAILERGGKVSTVVLNNENRAEVYPILKSKLKPEAIVLTDKSNLYYDLHKEFRHLAVNHDIGEYVRGDGNQIHTNGVECFFSILSRSIIGIYHQVTAKHLQKYCNEVSWRFERRKLQEKEKFDSALQQTEGRLKYKDLIANPVTHSSDKDSFGVRKM